MEPEGPVPEVSGSSRRVREVSSEAVRSGKSPGLGAGIRLYVRELVITQRESCYDSTYSSCILLSE